MDWFWWAGQAAWWTGLLVSGIGVMEVVKSGWDETDAAKVQSLAIRALAFLYLGSRLME